MLNRRQFAISGAAVLGLAPTFAKAQGTLAAADLGLIANAVDDQSDKFEEAAQTAAARGRALQLDAGIYRLANVALPSNVTIMGAGDLTELRCTGDAVFVIDQKSNVRVERLKIDGMDLGARENGFNLVGISGSNNIDIRECTITNYQGNGIATYKSSVRVMSCNMSRIGLSAIHYQDAIESEIASNRISQCGNGGVRVWRFENGFDGTVVHHNHISGIGSDWGNGQNGNGVNVFQSDHVIVSENVIQDCDFSAIRANTTNNTIITSNQCKTLREVAIFSEFAFSGSIVSQNLIEDAATGISITNLDDNGHLAVCSDNIVRKIWPASPTNPDTMPIGIFAEAEVAVTGNVVDDVPGVCIAAGWGAYLRNVLIANNVVTNGKVGIGVSIVDGVGACAIKGNLISGMSDAAIGGFEWAELADANLASSADRYPHLSISGNQVS